MYATRPALRLLLILGTLGLAVLAPPKGTYPIAWVMGLLMAPLVLLELGAGIEDEAERRRTLRLAIGLQLAGAVAFIAALGLAGGWHARAAAPPVLWGAALAAPGAAVAFVVLRDGLARFPGPTPPSPPPPSHLRATGWVMIACLGFVLAQLFVGLRRPELAAGPMFLAGLFLFGGGFVFALSLELDRWLLTRRGGHLRLARDLTQVFGFVLFGLGFVLFSGTDRAPVVLRGLFSVFGAALVVAGLWLGLRRFAGVKSGLVYVVCREGLYERTRGHRLLYPWGSILEVWLGELHGQSALHLRIDPAASAPVVLWCRRGSREALAAKRKKAHRTGEALLGASLSIMAISVDQELGTLAEALLTGLESEAARAERPSVEGQEVAA